MSVLHGKNRELLYSMIPDRGYIVPRTKSIDETRHRFVEETQELIETCRHDHVVGHETNRKRNVERERLHKAVSKLSDSTRDEIYKEFSRYYVMSDNDDFIVVGLYPEKYLQWWQSFEMAIKASRNPEPLTKPRMKLVRYVSNIFRFFNLPMSYKADGDLARYLDLVQDEAFGNFDDDFEGETLQGEAIESHDTRKLIVDILKSE